MKKGKSAKLTALILSFALVLSLVPGLVLAQNETPGIELNENTVAVIGENQYSSLADAVAAAGQDGVGSEITMVKSVTNTPRINITNKEITINLNGFDISFAQNGRFNVRGGTLNLEGEGMLSEESPYYAPVMLHGSSDEDAQNYSVVTVGADVTLQGWSGLFINQNSGANYGMVANVYGTLNSVKDTEGAGGHALYVNGSITNIQGAPIITLDGAELNCESGNGMYLAGYTQTVIKNSTITSSSEGGTGIEIRAGELLIINSTVTGGSGEYQGAPNGNGSTSFNVGLAVAQHTTKLPLSVTVESGVFTGGAAFIQANPQKNDEDAVAQVNISLDGGEFNGQVYSENKEGFISGGTYSEAIAEKYVLPGLSATDNGDGSFSVNGLQNVYLDGTNGDDQNNGADSDNPVKTLERAKLLAAQDGTIYISGQVTVTGNLRISGVIIKRAENYTGQLISVDGADAVLTVENAIIDGNNVEGLSSSAYLLFVTNGGTLNIQEGAQIINNRTTAVYINNNAYLNMSGGIIKDNRIQNIYSGGGGLYNAGTSVISGGEISSNSSNRWGGGILSERGTLTLNGVEIKNNTAFYYGGGVAVTGGTVIMDGDTVISGNTVDYCGGGVYVAGSANSNTVFEMRGGSIINNTATDNTGGGIFAYFVDEQPIIRISGGTISDNVSTNEVLGSAISLTAYDMEGEDYPKLELSGSPDISGDILFQNLYGLYQIDVTGEFNPASPIEINRSDNTAGKVAVEYTEGLTPNTKHFVSGAIFETLVVDGQTLVWADAKIIYFYDENGNEYSDNRHGVVTGGKIDPANVPTPTKVGYTLAGWRIQGTDTLWDFDADAVEVKGSSLKLEEVWSLNAPEVTVTADTLTPHIGETAVLTAQPSHDAENITYTYQWYKDGQLLEGQTQSTLTVSENGSYTVKVTAADGKNTTDAIESQPLVIAIQEHIAGSEWKTDENNHWHECTVCNDKLDEEAHDFEWVIDKEATKTETGSKHEECSVCGFEKPAVDIPMQTGDYSTLPLWLALAALCAAALTVIAIRRYKKTI